MNYSENFVTRKTKSEVAGAGANYRIEYIVRNEPKKAVNSITATISKVTTEGTPAVEKLTRVGNACLDMDNNRNYFAIERQADVTVDNQLKIATQYFADIKAILAEPIV